MKAKILFICLLFLKQGIGQNLVPNGGFEDNPQNYSGGTNPENYYSGVSCALGKTRFENDITAWKVANPSDNFVGGCSPDWMPGSVLDADGFCGTHTSFYLRMASKKENPMVELKDGYKLVKGQTYKFKTLVRAARGHETGTGSFQVVFSTEDEGLQVQPHKKWGALDFYLQQSCDFQYVEGYFTVPNSDDKDYEDMKYMVLQYNQGVNNVGGNPNHASLVLHFDDIVLVTEEKCVDHKYIQDRIYTNGEHKIEQANVQISAGQFVSPYPYDAQNPVTVKSGSMVIYRAPIVYIDTVTFTVEEGAYFETQVGTCVEDPCPALPTYTPSTTLAFCSPQTLGNDLPDIPGIFYEWTPSEYFSSPWSRITDFIPPMGNGCIDSKLKIWSICGPSQEYSFPVRYYDAASQVSITNIQTSQTKISFKANFENIQNYTLVVTNLSTGQVIYEDSVKVDCGTNLEYKTFILGFCDFDMCGDKEIKIIADNICFDAVEASFIAPSPVSVSPSLNISSVQHDDFTFSFDVAVNGNTEFVTVELWNEDLSLLECTKTFKSCDLELGQTTVHWDNSMCQSGCISVCGNHKIKVKYKNVCSAQVLEEMLYWNKTSNTIQVSNWTNVITPNGDGINDDLCVSVSGADWWEIWVEDRWGLIRHHEDGCVTSNPVCMWINPTSMPEDVYFYTVKFTNQCGSESVQNTQFIHIFTGFGFKDTEVDSSNTNEDFTDFSVIGRPQNKQGMEVYPNPVDDYLYIRSADKIQQSAVMDLNGKIIINSGGSNKINCSSLVTGAYIIEVKTLKNIERLKFIKL